MTTATSGAPRSFAPEPARLPPLENGDRLSRPEFERRYDAMPDLKKAELVNGVVHMPSPVRAKRHGGPHASIIGWLFAYQAQTPGVLVLDNASVRLDLDNEPQPDAVLLIEPALGGQARIRDDDSVEGAPELVVEVASSRASLDLHAKLDLYRRSGVREYLVWRVLDGAFDGFRAVEGRFEPSLPNDQGLWKSEQFPGLWFETTALIRGDLAAVLETHRLGLASAEHAEFEKRLNR